jgi:predicted PurR-regulated permease PerM
VVEKKSLEETLLVVLSASKVKRIMRIFEDIEIKISHWLQGQLVLMLAVGLASYLALLILGVRYALTLGLMAGILEAIPYIGPLTSTIVASLVALVNEGPMVAFWVAVSFIIIQQLENHILVPKIMGKFVGLSPVVIIIAMIVGGKFLGLGGIILAIPIATSLAVIIKDFVENPLS